MASGSSRLDETEHPDIKEQVFGQELDHQGECSNREDPIFDEIHQKIERSASQSTVASLALSNQEEYGGLTSDDFVSIPYGLQPKDAYEHGRKNTDIIGMTYNGRQRQFVILDSKGINTWKNDGVGQTTERPLTYPKYEYRLITNILYARKYNVYFALGKDFSLKVLNRDFDETCSITSDMRSVLFMLFNPVKDELITGGIGGVRVWQYHQVVEKAWKEIKPMANYRLDIKYELNNIGGHWVKRVDLDLNLQHLYCCSDTDLYAYDLEGHELFRFEKAHDMSITGCTYSPSARLLLTASVDTFVKAWSITGGLVHTFRGHSRAVSNLILHPETSSMFITSSLDGSVRIWSLDTMELFYNLTVSTDGVLWMGLTDARLLYLGTMRNITTWSLNHVTHFWAQARNKVLQLSLVHGEGKSTRVMAVGEDSSVRVFSRRTHKNLSTVLPPPSLSPLEHIRSVAYNRVVSVVFLLINTREIWVYTTRTDPACRVAVWNVLDIQREILYEYHRFLKSADGSTKGASSKQLAGISVSHRATEHGTGNDMISACYCVCYLNSEAMMWTEEGFCCPLRHNYLLFGLEDGRVLFMDPVVKGKKYFEFRANKDAIVNIVHDSDYQRLLTQCTVGEVALIQLWSLPQLKLLHEVLCAADVTGYVSLGSSFLTSHYSGQVVHHNLVPAVDSLLAPSALRVLINNPDDQTTESSVDIQRPDHQGPVVAIAACHQLGIFCTASEEGMIKVWQENKTLLTEIVVDGSLASLCFFNSSADLLIGYKNHIFIIDHTKVCPSIEIPEQEEDPLEEESDVHEDPAVMYEGVVANPDPINLSNYLVPFDIEFSKEFIEGKMGVREEVAAEDKCIEDDNESEASAAPTAVYKSPVSSPRRMSLLDLTLAANASDAELHHQMTHVLQGKADMGKNTGVAFEEGSKKATKVSSPIEMPVFGVSPGPSPCPSTPSSISTPTDFDVSEGGSIVSDDDDEEQLGKEFKIKENTFKPIQPPPVDTSQPVPVQEPVSVKTPPPVKRPGSSRVKEIRIDSQAVIKEEAIRQNRERKISRIEAPKQVAEPQVTVTKEVSKQEADPSPNRRVVAKKQLVSGERKMPRRGQKKEMSMPVVKQRLGEETRRPKPPPRPPKKSRTVLRKVSVKIDTESSSSESDDFSSPASIPQSSLEIKPRRFGASADSGAPSVQSSRSRQPMEWPQDGTMSQHEDMSQSESYSIPDMLMAESPGSRSGTPGAKVGFISGVDNDLDNGDAMSLLSQGVDSSVRFGSSGISNYPVISASISERISTDGLSVDEARSMEIGKPLFERSDSPTFTIYSDYGSEWTVPAVDDPELMRLQEIQEEGNQALKETTEAMLSRRYTQSAVAHSKSDPTLDRLKALRPHTAHVLPSHTKELERQYMMALKLYKGIPGSEDYVKSVYKNDGTKFGDDYHTKAIERHQLLRMQRQLRAQSALEKREKLAQMQQERWKTSSSHRVYTAPASSPAPGSTPSPASCHLPPNGYIPDALISGFLESRSPTREHSTKCGKQLRPSSKKQEANELVNRELYRARTSSSLAHASKFQDSNQGQLLKVPGRTQSAKDRDQNSRPHTAISRLSQASGGSEKIGVMEEQPFRGSINVKSANMRQKLPDYRVSSHPQIDISLLDPRNPESRLIRPVSKSIPSKCSRYLLVTNPSQDLERIIPTPLEEQLIVQRFPEWKGKWLDGQTPRSSRGHLVAHHINYAPMSVPH